MKISIKSCISGAEQARGVAVIIDVINASSTIVKLFEAGVKTVVPVGSIKQAKEMKKRTKNALICAEIRHKIRFVGVDFLNSVKVPKNLKGKTIIIKTNAGTKGLLGAKKADRILVGCFLNSGAVVDYIKKLKPKHVSLVPMGNSGKSPAAEDELCAQYLKKLLHGERPDFAELKKQIIKRSVKNRLRLVLKPKTTSEILKLNTSKIVPELVDGRIVVR